MNDKLIIWQTVNRKKLPVVIGYIGVAAITINSFPAIWQALAGGQHAPLSSILLMSFGLVCCLYNSIKTGAKLYTVANSLGLALNLLLFYSCVR